MRNPIGVVALVSGVILAGVALEHSCAGNSVEPPPVKTSLSPPYPDYASGHWEVRGWGSRRFSMGKITERVSRPDDPIFREGLADVLGALGAPKSPPPAPEKSPDDARRDGGADGVAGKRLSTTD
jgi:hypothetical protein